MVSLQLVGCCFYSWVYSCSACLGRLIQMCPAYTNNPPCCPHDQHTPYTNNPCTPPYSTPTHVNTIIPTPSTHSGYRQLSPHWGHILTPIHTLHTPTYTVVTQLSPHWGHILAVFDVLLDTLRRNHVPPFLVRKLFQQLFSFVNVQLFNQLLLRRECCSFSNGEYVKTGLAEVEMWIAKAGSDWVGESWEELKYIRQVCCCCCC